MYRLIQKVNDKANLKLIAKQICRLNMFRSRGLFCLYIMDAQWKSTDKTDLYANLTSIINREVRCSKPDGYCDNLICSIVYFVFLATACWRITFETIDIQA